MADFFLGLLGTATETYMNERNIEFQEWANRQNMQLMRETNEQNEELMRESWRREDTSVQRRAADLRAAGMNPILAAGGGASAGSPIQLRAPQVEAPQQRSNPGMTALVAANAMADIQAKKASIAQTKQQTKVAEREAERLDLDNKLKASTMEPRIQEAVAAAKVAASSADSRIEISAAEAKRARLEAQAAETFYWDRAEKENLERQILVEKSIAQKIITDVMAAYSGPQAQAELFRTQMQAAAAAASAKIQTIDAEALEKMKLSPAGWKRLMDIFDVAFRGVALMKK